MARTFIVLKGGDRLQGGHVRKTEPGALHAIGETLAARSWGCRRVRGLQREIGPGSACAGQCARNMSGLGWLLGSNPVRIIHGVPSSEVDHYGRSGR